jgi:hypothetical protein
MCCRKTRGAAFPCPKAPSLSSLSLFPSFFFFPPRFHCKIVGQKKEEREEKKKKKIL